MQERRLSKVGDVSSVVMENTGKSHDLLRNYITFVLVLLNS